MQSLSEKQRKRLEGSWAGVFYERCFCRISEETFAVLYADCPSRPNTPVNVLVGLELLKAGFGWSDEELYDAFSFNVQVRYALGYQDLGRVTLPCGRCTTFGNGWPVTTKSTG
jgi:hypothetical protein